MGKKKNQKSNKKKDRKEAAPITTSGKHQKIQAQAANLDFADYLAYADAASYGLPTIEQVEELANYCRWQRDFRGQTFYGATCIGKNGKEIYIRSWGYKEGDRLCCYGYGADTIFFWIRNEEEGDEMKAIKLNNVKDEKPEFEIVKLFSGYKLPVMLVSNK